MTAFTARGRAEEFDSLVEGTSAGRSDERYADFLDIVASLRSVPEPEARPEFVTSLRERLMTAAETELVAAADEARLTLPPRRPARERRLAAAVGGLAIVGATTSIAVAAQSALPGDALYPLKRAIESAQTGFSVDEGEKGSHMLANATGRLDEISALTREGELKDDVAIAPTLNTFTEQATEASDLLLSDYAATGHESSIAQLRDFTAASMATLTDLESVVPTSARDELLHAARVLQQIDAEAEQTCPTCGGAGITDLPPILTAFSSFGTTGATTDETVAQTGNRGGNGGKQDPVLPNTGTGTLPPGSVLNPSTGSGTSTGTGTGQQAPSQTSNPLSDLANGLIGGGDSQPTSNNPPSLPLPGLPAVEDTLEDLTDPLLGGN
jgi:hypothetical protein